MTKMIFLKNNVMSATFADKAPISSDSDVRPINRCIPNDTQYLVNG